MPSFRRPAPLLSLLILFTISSLAVLARPLPQQEEIVIQGSPGAPVARDVMPALEPPPIGTATVEGVVVSADLGRPVRRALVRLSSTVPRPPQTAVSDDNGRFHFQGIAAGEFTLTASKPGYLESAFGQRQPGSGRPGTPISIANGQRIERLSVPIARGGVLTGTVADDGGEPAFGTEVRAYKSIWQRGERSLRLAGSDKADDRGAFRIAALPPGEYLVMASPAGDPANREDMALGGPLLGGVAMGRMVESNVSRTAVTGSAGSSGYAPVFFPGTTSSAAATRVTIGVSEERSGLDMQLPLVAMTTLTGTVMSDNGAPAIGTMVRLVDLDMPVPGFGLRVTGTGPDGRFTFHQVPPGRYRLHAQNGPQNRVVVEDGPLGAKVMMQFTNAAREGPAGAWMAFPPAAPSEVRWAAADLAITGADAAPVALVLQPGVSVSGRIVFDTTGQQPSDLSAFRVTLTSADPSDPGLSTSLTEVAADGRFTIVGVAPGTYRVTLLSPTSWQPKSFVVNGRDALDFLLSVDANQPITDATFTLTTRAASLSGSLVDASGRPATAYTIVLFADEATYWTPGSRRIQAARPSTTGRFTLSNLPAGSYRLVAVDDVEDGQWSDPDVLRQLAGVALPLTLADGESKTQDVRVAR
jgi:hypothetical protein